MRKINVQAYQHEWKQLFEVEAEKLRDIFIDNAIAIHHIGSTAVTGLSAKAVIDIMIEVQHIEAVDALSNSMRALGYEVLGENGIAGRRYFQKGGNNRTHHVHVFEKGSEHIIRHLAFRDYLREHSEVAKQYGDLKQSLAQQFPKNIAAYIEGKNDVVLSIEKEAVRWYKARHSFDGLEDK